MPLFYIAFYQLDVVTLRAEIASLFMSESLLIVLSTYINSRIFPMIIAPIYNTTVFPQIQIAEVLI